MSCRRRGRAVARVEVRQLRPAALAGEQERGLAFLPRDGARRPEQIELHRRLVGMEIGEAGAPRVRVERVVQPARLRGHRGQRRPLGRAAGRIEPAADRRSLEHSEAEARLDARQPRRPPRAPPTMRLVLAGREHEAEVHAIVLAAGGAVLHGQAGAPHQALDAALEARMRLAGDAQVVPPRRRRAPPRRPPRPAAPAAPASAPSCPARDRSDRRAPRSPSAARPRPCRTGSGRPTRRSADRRRCTPPRPTPAGATTGSSSGSTAMSSAPSMRAARAIRRMRQPIDSARSQSAGPSSRMPRTRKPSGRTQAPNAR